MSTTRVRKVAAPASRRDCQRRRKALSTVLVSNIFDDSSNCRYVRVNFFTSGVWISWVVYASSARGATIRPRRSGFASNTRRKTRKAIRALCPGHPE